MDSEERDLMRDLINGVGDVYDSLEVILNRLDEILSTIKASGK